MHWEVWLHTWQFTLGTHELRLWRLDIHRDADPLPLPKARHAQSTPSHVADEDRHPDIARLQSRRRFKHQAEAEGNDDLREE